MKRLIFLLPWFFLLSACINFGGKPAPPQKTYMLSVRYPKLDTRALTRSRLLVAPTTASSPYNMNLFIYRIKGNQYLSDYYHAFLVSPTEQITNIVSIYLGQEPLFSNVQTIDEGGAGSEYVLKSHILSLYADYQHSAYPKAVISIRFQLVRTTPEKTDLMNKVFSMSVPLRSKTNKALVAAWDRALQQILAKVYSAIYPIVLH